MSRLFCARIPLLIVAAWFSMAAATRADPPKSSDSFPACNSCGHHRAGHPQHVARWARVTDDAHHCGYYVGGGAALLGDGRTPHDGTWGWDYGGLLFPKRIALKWWHGRKRQGGTGAYQTDGGPHLRPHH